MPLQTRHTQVPVAAEPDAAWYEAMMRAISRCAPVVVRTLAGLEGGAHDRPDRDVLAGQVILHTAEVACHERWSCAEFETKAEAIVMQCLAAEYDAIAGPAIRGACAPPTPGRRLTILRALDHLDDLRLQVLALIVQERLTVPETAGVLGLPEWRVHQECAQAMEHIQRQLRACQADPDHPGAASPAATGGECT